MKLPVMVTREPRHRGQPTEFVARLGSLEVWGTSRSNALAALASKIERVASEPAAPVIRIDPADGHAWVTYRGADGRWVMSHYRPFTRPDVPEGAVIGRGTMFVSVDGDDRDEVVAAMDRHFLQLHGPPCIQHMGCWCWHHARGAKYSEPCNATE